MVVSPGRAVHPLLSPASLLSAVSLFCRSRYYVSNGRGEYLPRKVSFISRNILHGVYIVHVKQTSLNLNSPPARFLTSFLYKIYETVYLSRDPWLQYFFAILRIRIHYISPRFPGICNFASININKD